MGGTSRDARIWRTIQSHSPVVGTGWVVRSHAHLDTRDERRRGNGAGQAGPESHGSGGKIAVWEWLDFTMTRGVRNRPCNIRCTRIEAADARCRGRRGRCARGPSAHNCWGCGHLGSPIGENAVEAARVPEGSGELGRLELGK
eukprot:scaffold75245_cov29-Tisochrysis_lutea.AAC.3